MRKQCVVLGLVLLSVLMLAIMPAAAQDEPPPQPIDSAPAAPTVTPTIGPVITLADLLPHSEPGATVENFNVRLFRIGVEFNFDLILTGYTDVPVVAVVWPVRADGTLLRSPTMDQNYSDPSGNVAAITVITPDSDIMSFLGAESVSMMLPLSEFPAGNYNWNLQMAVLAFPTQGETVVLYEQELIDPLHTYVRRSQGDFQLLAPVVSFAQNGVLSLDEDADEPQLTASFDLSVYGLDAGEEIVVEVRLRNIADHSLITDPAPVQIGLTTVSSERSEQWSLETSFPTGEAGLEAGDVYLEIAIFYDGELVSRDMFPPES